jgi:NAD(P)-dependent dehydrogenase (short-subunit alcohol dehydrogenase family)
MDLQLKGKRALVTGSTSGIGEATARLLAREGAAVIVHGRRAEVVAETVATLTWEGHRAAGAVGDLSTDAGADQAAAEALNAFGGIDILVNNAGLLVAPNANAAGDWLSGAGSVQAAALYEANVNSVFRMVQRIVPQMRTQGWGRIVMLGSVAATMPREDFPQYSVTKAANLNQAVSLSRLLAGTGITVNAVSPGLIRTPAVEPMIRGWAQHFGWGEDWEAIERSAATDALNSATRRLGRPEDIARAVAFLASPLSDFINGANLRVDGGTNPTVN